MPDVPAALPDFELEDLVLEVQLVKFDQGKDKFSLSGVEKLAKSEIIKEVGTNLFRAGRFRRAEEVWQRGVDLFNTLQSEMGVNGPDLAMRAENDRCRTAQCPLFLNTALCKIKRKAWTVRVHTCYKE